MSIHVFYQPIDVDAVHRDVFGYVRGDGGVNGVLESCDDREAALSVLEPFRDAYRSRQAGEDYTDPERGRCDPTEFIADGFVRASLGFCRHVWPHWLVNASTSIELLPNGFPVLEHYQMPIALFGPFAEDIPEIGYDLETIANCEMMGGLVLVDHVPQVRAAVATELANMVRDAIDPHWYDATESLLAALAYAQENGLSFTEAIE